MPDIDWNTPAIANTLDLMRANAASLPDADPHLVADLTQHAVNEALRQINIVADRAPGFNNQLLIGLYTLQMLQACSNGMQQAVRRIARD